MSCLRSPIPCSIGSRWNGPFVVLCNGNPERDLVLVPPKRGHHDGDEHKRDRHRDGTVASCIFSHFSGVHLRSPRQGHKVDGSSVIRTGILKQEGSEEGTRMGWVGVEGRSKIKQATNLALRKRWALSYAHGPCQVRRENHHAGQLRVHGLVVARAAVGHELEPSMVLWNDATRTQEMQHMTTIVASLRACLR